MAALSSILTYQPVKGIWTLFAVLLNAARIPLWIILYTPRSLRPNPNWSLVQSVRVRIIRAFLWNASMVEMRVPVTLEPRKEKERFITMPPAQSSYYTGVTLSDPDIQPIEIGGTWYPEKPSLSGQKPGLVALHFHGGAYAIGDGREEDAGFAAKTLLKNTDVTHVFCPQYRLVTAPNCRFPAQLQDAISAYVYLQFAMGIPAEKIVVGGDSAGGHLTLCLLRYISESGDKIGLNAPGCAWLWSPWSSPQAAEDRARFNSNPFAASDYVVPTFGAWGSTNLAPSPRTGLTLHSPMLDYVGHPFATKTPLWIQYGGGEVLLHDGVKMAEELRLTEGNIVDVEITKHAPHDIILIGHLLGFAEEAKNAAILANEFLRKQVGAPST